jgi:hypothetical protein
MLEPFDDVEVTASRLETLDKAASSGRVTLRSTSSGPAPAYVVITTRYGGLISGVRSIGKLIRAKSPSPISNTNIIKMVVGLPTTPFAILTNIS